MPKRGDLRSVECRTRERLQATQMAAKAISVSKPKWLIIPSEQTDLPGSIVRSIRLAVMKRVLLPAGFVKGKGGRYVRRISDQIHLIYFQPDKWGHRYTVNLGFHYEFLKPLFARKRIPLPQYHLLDCALQARIGFFKCGRDKWFEYGDNRTRLEEQLKQNATDALQILSRYSKRWVDPRIWLTRVRSTSSNRNWHNFGHWHTQELSQFQSNLRRHFVSSNSK